MNNGEWRLLAVEQLEGHAKMDSDRGVAPAKFSPQEFSFILDAMAELAANAHARGYDEKARQVEAERERAELPSIGDQLSAAIEADEKLGR